MIYRPPQDADFPGMQALDLELAHLEDPKFEALSERERAGRLRSSLAALRFYARSEHSFAAVEHPDHDPSTVLGFVLAQSVWMGDKPIVWVSCLRVHLDAPGGTLAGLLHAVTKSAYDGAVYELHLPATPEVLKVAEKEGYVDSGVRHLVRYLGSRARTAPGADDEP